jgi:hypothetical protein
MFLRISILLIKATRRHIAEENILHFYLRVNNISETSGLQSYIYQFSFGAAEVTLMLLALSHKLARSRNRPVCFNTRNFTFPSIAPDYPRANIFSGIAGTL